MPGADQARKRAALTQENIPTSNHPNGARPKVMMKLKPPSRQARKNQNTADSKRP